MNVKRIGLGLAKSVFRVHGIDERGKTVLRRQLRRNRIHEYFSNPVPCLIGVEACASPRYRARTLIAMGHTVRLIAPRFAKPYVKGNKNDANGAEAIRGAAGRPNMRFVPVKSVARQDIQALHRARSERVHQRAAEVNQIRGLPGEYGIVVAQRVTALRRALPEILEDGENGLTGSFRQLPEGLREDPVSPDARTATRDPAVQKLASEHAGARRLLKLRGAGPITATALAASPGDGRMFRRGREASARVGTVPGQHSSGGKDKPLGVGERGDACPRTLLIHGARAVIKTAKDKDDSPGRRIQNLCGRRNKDIAAVALANTTLRMAWAVLAGGENYRAPEERAHAQPARVAARQAGPVSGGFLKRKKPLHDCGA